MAVCGLLSMLCVSPIQPDMDSCPSDSFGVTRNHLNLWPSGTEARASSCLSSTMVDRNDPDDAESSQPPTPSRDAKESVIRDASLPRHELELSISSLNDAQRNIQRSTPQRFIRPVKEEFDPTAAGPVREDTVGVSVGEEETTVSGPPRKRSRISPLGFRLEEGQIGNVREQLLRHSSLSVSSDLTGVHGLMPSRSLPSFRSTEREGSPGPSRGISAGPSKPTTSWWLAPKTSPLSTEATGTGRANFAVETRGLIPGTALQERDFLFKEPSFFPNMLSSMETSEHLRRVEDAPPTEGARPRDQGRSEGLLDHPSEHVFFSRKESSSSRVSSTSTVSEETLPRSGAGLTFSVKDREAPLQPESSNVYGQQIQHPLEAGRRRNSSAPESQYGAFERELLPSGFSKPPSLMEQKSFQAPPVGNANSNFYARILDAAQRRTSSRPPASQAGFTSVGVHVSPGQLLPGGSPQMGASAVQLGGESSNPNLAPQQLDPEILRNLLGGHPNVRSFPPYVTPVQGPDPTRLSFPNLSSLDFLQSLQRPAFPQVGDRFRHPLPGQVVGGRPPQQDFAFLGPPAPSYPGLSVELHPSLPSRSNQPATQTSSGLRDFLSPQGPSSSVGLGRGPATRGHGFSPAFELPMNLSLQAPEAPRPLTVVMEGRSIGRRISLEEHDGYGSFAAALRTMFESHVSSEIASAAGESCTLANAVPGYVIAYEDEEGDVLLAGDLPWRDFVRVAKQIRIVSSSKISFKPPTGPFQS